MTNLQFSANGAAKGRDDSGASVAVASRDLNDRALVALAQSGDTVAFDKLVNKYRDRVLKLCLRYTRNWADAEDAAQATFLKAYLGLRQFRGDAAFYSWLHRIAVNTVKTLCARLSRESGALGREPEEDSGWDATLPMNIETPEEIALSDELSRVVSEAIERLNCEQRTAIVLLELEGRSYSAVALEMSCPIGTVRSRVFRAREAIDIEVRRLLDGGISRVRHSLWCRMATEPGMQAAVIAG